jgi:hypothetical protein
MLGDAQSDRVYVTKCSEAVSLIPVHTPSGGLKRNAKKKSGAVVPESFYSPTYQP